MAALKIVYRDPRKLVPYENNPRSHSPGQIEQIRASIREYGFTQPILLRDEARIGAGHGRWEAAIAEDLPKVPTITITGLTEEQWRAYIIADNKIALGSDWDIERLHAEIEALSASDYDLSLTGFNPDELEALFAPEEPVVNRSPVDPEQTPDVEIIEISRRGDVWLCGDHRVMCGSSTDHNDLAKAIGGKRVDLACSDPPYGLNVVKGGTIGGAKPFSDKNKKGRAKAPVIAANNYAPIIGDDTTETAIAHYKALVALNVPVIVLWGGNYFASALPDSRCWLIWDKENTGTFADAELAWTNQDKVVKLIRHQWSGLIKASERGEKRVHPTQKPVALAEWVFETLGEKATVILDGFLGSGWTLIAAERTGRECVGIELSPAYVDVAVRRWERFSGKSAILESTRQTFAEVSEERAGEAEEIGEVF